MVLDPIPKIPATKDPAPRNKAHKGISISSYSKANLPSLYTLTTAIKGPTQLPTLFDPWAKATQAAEIINKGLKESIAT